MKASYLTPEHDIIGINVYENEIFANTIGPFNTFTGPNQKYWDELQVLIRNNELIIDEYVKPMSFLEFFALFTPLEQKSIVESSDITVKIMLLRATGASYIQLNNQDLINGIHYLVSINLLTNERAQQILSGTPLVS